MIVRTRIDPAAIRDAVATSNDGGKAVLTRLATELRRHGALVSGSDLRQLEEVLDPRETPIKPAVSQLWKELLGDLRRWGRLVEADHGVGAATFDLTVSEDPTVAAPGKVTSPELLDRSQTIQRLRQMKYRENYKSGADSRVIWGDRFAPCARISRRVAVVDRFLFFKPQVAPWILGRLVKDAPTIRIDFIGASPDDRDVDQVRRQLANLHAGRRPAGRLRVWLVPWGQGPRPHNRHVRFSCGAAFTLEEGFDRFVDEGGGSSVWGSSGVTPHYVPADDPHLAGLKSIEGRLKAVTPEAQRFSL